MRGPPAATMVLAIASATTGVGGSPTPVGGHRFVVVLVGDLAVETFSTHSASAW
jgi:hypothetical protein